MILTRLKEFYNQKIVEVKSQLSESIKNVSDKVTQIKLIEISSLITEADKNTKVSNDDIVNLLQYYSLVEELNNVK